MILAIPKDTPTTPGVYFFRDKKGTLVYIGKALNLRNRLRGHPMLEKADTVEWQETGSDIEALILESQLIKKHKPFYNISLRDDKNYAYVIFTDEDYPKIFVGHRGDDAVGPFTSSTELRAALKVFRKLFPYCTCRQKHNRLCLNAHIGKCLGFCCLKEVQSEKREAQKKAYRKNIRLIHDILSGKRPAFMKQFPNVFANAKVIREISGRHEALAQLQKIFQLPKLPIRIEGYDISNIQGTHATGSMVVFENGYPDKAEYRKFKIRAPSSPDDFKMLREMLERRRKHAEWPAADMLLIDGGKGQLNMATDLFPVVLSIAKGKQEIFSTTLERPIAIKDLPPTIQNLLVHIDEEAHRFAITYYRKLHGRNLRK